MKPNALCPTKMRKKFKAKSRGGAKSILKSSLGFKNTKVWQEKMKSLESKWNALDNSFGLERFQINECDQSFANASSSSDYNKLPSTNDEDRNCLLGTVTENSLIIECEDCTEGQEFDCTIDSFVRDRLDSDTTCENEEASPFEICTKKRQLPKTEEYIKEKNFHSFRVPEKNLLITVLPHPITIAFEGLALMCVVTGKVCILGHQMEASDSFVPLYSTSELLYLDITTMKSENICRQTVLLQMVKQKLFDIGIDGAVANDILDSCDNSSVILAFKKNCRAYDIHFSCLFESHVFNLKKNNLDFCEKQAGFRVDPMKEDLRLDFSHTKSIIKSILSYGNSSENYSGNFPKVLVQGNKSVGKSTFLRFLVNKVLNSEECVYYLDGDPGQTEFTPPGCISLVKITTPLLGPSFTHLLIPEKMLFLGRVSVEEITTNYINCIHKLYEYYKAHHSSAPLFVNTMGWITGTGGILLEKIKTIVEPTHVVRIESTDSMKFMSTPRDNEYIFYRSHLPTIVKGKSRAPMKRNLAILAYLGRCQKPYDELISLNAIKPYCIPWKHLALHVCYGNIPNTLILHALNGSWVALCCVDESNILKSDDETKPNILKNEPGESECLGFGVVRNIDVAKKALYIITPEDSNTLKKVNAIMKGNINLPNKLYVNQTTKDSIPYTVKLLGKNTPLATIAKKRRNRFLPSTH